MCPGCGVVGAGEVAAGQAGRLMGGCAEGAQIFGDVMFKKQGKGPFPKRSHGEFLRDTLIFSLMT